MKPNGGLCKHRFNQKYHIVLCRSHVNDRLQSTQPPTCPTVVLPSHPERLCISAEGSHTGFFLRIPAVQKRVLPSHNIESTELSQTSCRYITQPSQFSGQCQEANYVHDIASERMSLLVSLLYCIILTLLVLSSANSFSIWNLCPQGLDNYIEQQCASILCTERLYREEESGRK